MQTLLIIENDTALADLYRHRFGAQEGLKVEIVPNSIGKPEEERRAIERIKPDLLLIYIRPDGEGIVALETLCKEGKMPPTIVVTYDTREETRERCLKLGVKHYCIKTELTISSLWRLIADHFGFSSIPPWKKESNMVLSQPSQKTILLVEDDSILRELYLKKFREWQEGIQIHTTVDYDQATQFLSQKQPDVLIIDVLMPDGFRVLEFVREHQWQFPVIAIGTSYDEKIIKRAKSLKVTEYFGNKDSTIKTLLEAVEKYVSPPHELRKAIPKNDLAIPPVEVTGGSPDQAGKTVLVPIENIAVSESVQNVMDTRVRDDRTNADRAYPPYFKNVKYKKVLKALDNALWYLPDDPVLLGKKGNCLEAQEKYIEALEIYEKSLATYPAFLPNMYNKAFCLERIKFNNEACIPYFDEIIRYYPHEVKAWANKGKMLMRRNRMEEALECCEKALSLDPNDFTALCTKGHIADIQSGKSSNSFKTFLDMENQL